MQRHQPDELPALPVVHRGIGDALETAVSRPFYEVQELERLRIQGFLIPSPLHFMEQPVQLHPHLGADLLPHMARILPRGGNRGHDGITVARRVRQIANHVWVRRGGFAGVLVRGSMRRQTGDNQPPALVGRLRRHIEHQIQMRADQARGVLRPLQVAAHPVQTVGDAREHQSTQVSLLPPPCDELTTSEPRRSATRVNPPGTIVIFSPYRM